MKKKPANSEIRSFFYFPVGAILFLLLLRILIYLDYTNFTTAGLGLAMVGAGLIFTVGFQILVVYLLIVPFAVLSTSLYSLKWNIFGLIGLMILSIAIAFGTISAGLILPEYLSLWFF